MSHRIRVSPLIVVLAVTFLGLIGASGRAEASPAVTSSSAAIPSAATAKTASPAVATSATSAQTTTPPAELLGALGASPTDVTTTNTAHLARLASSDDLVMVVTDIAHGWVAGVTKSGTILAAPYRAQVTVPIYAVGESRVSGLTGILAIARTRNIATTDVSGMTPLVAGTAAGSSSSSSSALWISLALIGGVFLFFVTLGVLRRLRSRVGGGGGDGSMSSISSHSKIRSTSKVRASRIRFADVAGVDEAIEELRETVAFLTSPERFAAAGARMPRGVILYGPPGTGKTMLACAVSGESGVPYYSLSGSEFVESLVGVGASRVRDLFAKARKHKTGAVIFIDEIDAVGRKRGSVGGGADERETTLNQLLVELDGFIPSERIVIIAATNRLELLDDALTRPGRFDRHIEVSLPAERGRREILAVHAANKHLHPEADLDHVASITAGMSGADLAKLLNEAAIMSVRADRTQISNADLAEGMLRTIAGPEKKDRALAHGELERIAWHEAGHALAAELCPTHPKVQRMTILARGMAAALALFGDTDSALLSPQGLHERMVVALAGRAAEQIGFGAISSGAANDLEQANRLARQAVERLGFAPQVGQIVTSVGEHPIAVAEDTRRDIDRAVGGMMDAAYAEALTLLTDHRTTLVALAETVLEHEQLDRHELDVVLWEIQHPGQHRAPSQVRALPTDRHEEPSATPEHRSPIHGGREFAIRLSLPRRLRAPHARPQFAFLRRGERSAAPKRQRRPRFALLRRRSHLRGLAD